MDPAGGPLRLFSDRPRVEHRNRRVGESTWTYLENSAFSGDDRVRAQFESMVSGLPPEHGRAIISRLKDNDHRRVNEAVAELVVHQALLELGRDDIEVDPPTPDGKTDFRLDGPGLHLEVTRIGESREDHGKRQRKHQVLQELNRLECGRFSLHGTLHGGVGKPSVKKVRSEINEWLGTLDSDTERQALEDDRVPYIPPSRLIEFDDWSIDLVAYPLAPGAPPETIIARLEEPFSAGPVTVESIRNALAKKRHQHRNLVEPMIVALDVSQGMVSANTLADALYGGRPLQGWDRPIDMDALWPTPGRSGCPSSTPPRSPRVAGVLVLDHLHLSHLTAIESVLWLPPDNGPSVLAGPWSTARWTPGAGYGADIHIEDSPQKVLLTFSEAAHSE